MWRLPFYKACPKSEKLWVKLPAECLQLLGASDDTRMLLVKPVYGQLDAPRRDGTLRLFAVCAPLAFGNTSWILAPFWSMSPTLRIPMHLANLVIQLLEIIGCVA